MSLNRWTCKELKDSIIKSQIAFDEIYGSSGESVLLIARGARILGMFPSADDDASNALWVNPLFERLVSGSLTDWVADGMGSVGGDRLWLSPEQSFYYKKPHSFEGWGCPVEMDPGHYHRVSCTGRLIVYRNSFDLLDYITGEVHRQIVMTRDVAYLSNPYSSLPFFEKGKVRYVGVRTVEAVVASASEVNVRIQPWVLTQIPVGTAEKPGTVIVPVNESADPIGYFADIPADRIKQTSDHVSFRIDALQIHKLGIRPEDLRSGKPAEIAYILDDPNGNDSTFLVRRTFHVPSSQADCYDTAKGNPEGPRGTIQSYNHGPVDGGDYPHFGEVEIQLSPLRREPTGWYARAVTEILVFQGPKESVLSLVRPVLGIHEEPALF